jgi:hypothetical protein
MIIIDSVGTSNASGLIGAPGRVVGDKFERIRGTSAKWVDPGMMCAAVSRKAMQIQNTKEAYISAHRSSSPQGEGN